MSDHVLLGPFLTRAQAARWAGAVAASLPHRPDLLRIPGPLGEAYFAFQFDEFGVRPDLSRVVRSLHGHVSDVAVASWLVEPNPALDNSSPLGWLNGGGSGDRVLEAAQRRGPAGEDWGRGVAAEITDHPTIEPKPAERRRAEHVGRIRGSRPAGSH
jgi:hypothetical protein